MAARLEAERKAEEERQAEEARKAEEARAAEEYRKAEEARKAEEERQAEEVRQVGALLPDPADFRKESKGGRSFSVHVKRIRDRCVLLYSLRLLNVPYWA